MKTKRTNIFIQQERNLIGLDTSLSFRGFLSHLQKRIAETQGAQKEIFQSVYDMITKAEMKNGQISAANVHAFEHELFYVYSLLVPPMADEHKTLWALGLPVRGTPFYGTDAFYQLLEQEQIDEKKLNANLSINGNKECLKENQLLYSFILERLYGFPALDQENLLYGYIDQITGLPRYYEIKLDFTFVDVMPVDKLPELDQKLLRQQTTQEARREMFAKLLPLDSFKFEGFTVISVANVCVEHALENIKNLIIDRSSHDQQNYYDELELSLRILVENPNVNFRLLPLLTINGKAVFDEKFAHGSVLFGDWKNQGSNIALANQFLADYTKKPTLITFNLDLEIEDSRSIFTDTLKKLGINTYVCSPLFYNGQITGLVEVYTEENYTFNKITVGRLKRVSNLLAQLLFDRAGEYYTKIDAVIKEKFTSLQPSVQWKFTEVAWEYLQKLQPEKSKPAIGLIQFNHVHPIYGAIDIRNSTIERNHALTADLTVQLELLMTVLQELNHILQIALIEEIQFNCQLWLNRLVDEPMDQLQQNVRNFLDKEIPETLGYFKESNPQAAIIINRYEEDIHAQTGIAFAKRRALETSMAMVNQSVNNYLELLNAKIQQSYPCYFEKFRTDGVEYDIYIGQSITPHIPFNKLFLKNVQLWQLTSMASIAKITHSLLPHMPHPLETTQLIFVNTGDIDISFRVDERRFDVEGAYNIRYQVIKKRIDKVHLKGSDERLTQPGKVALVYFSESDVKEYKKYITYLQNQDILLHDLEELELEELQGVTGLKALRIGVNLEVEGKGLALGVA
ncbi:hypothetical protein SAMN05216436_11197 [bacterium A37T11]|nr:hypothetical protein SAMN05216436_11197 [bacterium A37T11]